MSHFIFGTISRNLENLQFNVKGCHIIRDVPEIIIEMLKGQGEDEISDAFLIVGDSIHDTSDCLIAPYISVEVLCFNLKIIADVVQYGVENLGLERIYITEGFDNKFQTIESSLGKFYTDACNALFGAGYWPSVCFEFESENKNNENG